MVPISRAGDIINWKTTSMLENNKLVPMQFKFIPFSDFYKRMRNFRIENDVCICIILDNDKLKLLPELYILFEPYTFMTKTSLEDLYELSKIETCKIGIGINNRCLEFQLDYYNKFYGFQKRRQLEEIIRLPSEIIRMLMNYS